MTRSATTRTRVGADTHVCRSGITLLEVLISMFVALVGLSGLAALFWLGGVEMSEGAKFDRAVSVGRSAQRALKIYGILRPVQTYISTTNPGGNPTTTAYPMQMWVTPPITAAAATTTSTTPLVGQFVDSSVPASSPPPPTPLNPMMPFAGTPSSTPTNYFNTAGTYYGFGDYTQGFAIDPIGVIANQSNIITDTAGHQYPAAPAFPAINGTANATPQSAIFYAAPPPAAPKAILPCLNRVTLMSFPQAFPTNQSAPYLWKPGSTPGVPPTQTYSAGQADLVFRSSDDLLLNSPNGDFPPTQLYSASGRRQSQGDYSWLATVVPGFSTYEAYTPLPPAPQVPIYTPNGNANLARVSIVVFYKRNPLITIDPAGVIPPSERMVEVLLPPIGSDGTTGTGNILYPTGIGGGEIQLSALTSVPQSYLNVKPGQWIMLSQESTKWNETVNGFASPPVTGGPIAPYSTYWYRWYKVVAVGAIKQGIDISNNHVNFRSVTISGPDWNAGSAVTLSPAAPTYASIVDGVVAVFEKEVELEQTGAPWAPN